MIGPADRGHPPRSPSDPNATLREAIIWTTISAAGPNPRLSRPSARTRALARLHLRLMLMILDLLSLQSYKSKLRILAGEAQDDPVEKVVLARDNL